MKKKTYIKHANKQGLFLGIYKPEEKDKSKVVLIFDVKKKCHLNCRTIGHDQRGISSYGRFIYRVCKFTQDNFIEADFERYIM